MHELLPLFERLGSLGSHARLRHCRAARHVCLLVVLFCLQRAVEVLVLPRLGNLLGKLRAIRHCLFVVLRHLRLGLVSGAPPLDSLLYSVLGLVYAVDRLVLDFVGLVVQQLLHGLHSLVIGQVRVGDDRRDLGNDLLPRLVLVAVRQDRLDDALALRHVGLLELLVLQNLVGNLHRVHVQLLRDTDGEPAIATGRRAATATEQQQHGHEQQQRQLHGPGKNPSLAARTRPTPLPDAALACSVFLSTRNDLLKAQGRAACALDGASHWAWRRGSCPLCG